MAVSKADNRASKVANRVNKAVSKALAVMNARSSAVSTTFQNGCKRQSKAHAARTVRALKKTSTARVNSQTTSIRCVGAWMKTRRVETGSSKVINKVNAGNKVSRGKANKANRDRKASRAKVNPANRVNKDNKDNRVNKVNLVSKDRKVNRINQVKQAAPKTAVTAAVAAKVPDQPGVRWAATGATIVNSVPKSANACAKLKTCDVNGAQPAWAPVVSTK